MRIAIATLALLCLAASVNAQTFTAGDGTTYQLQTVRVCDGLNCHLEAQWIPVSTQPPATFEIAVPAAKKMPKTPEQLKGEEPPYAMAPAVCVRFPMAHAAAARGRHLLGRLRHPFGGRFGGNCGCNGACGGAGCTCR